MHARHLYTVLIEKERCGKTRDEVLMGLHELGIGTGIHYTALHLHRYYRERFADVGWQENVVYDGIIELLAMLVAQRQRLFLCTAKPEIFARRIVEHFGFASHFLGIYGADLAGAFDDKAKLLRRLLTAERLDASETVMIGDRGNDVRAAHANDVCAIGVLWGFGSREELADADALAVNPQNLERLLKRQIPSSRTASGIA